MPKPDSRKLRYRQVKRKGTGLFFMKGKTKMSDRWSYKAHKRLDKQPERLWDMKFLYDVYLFDYQKKERTKLITTFDDKSLIWDWIRQQKLLNKKNLYVVERREK